MFAFSMWSGAGVIGLKGGLRVLPVRAAEPLTKTTFFAKSCRMQPCTVTPMLGLGSLRMMSGAGTSAGEDTIVSSVERKLVEALQPKSITVKPTYGDPNGSHVSINVVSDAFEGLNTVKRHKLVYKTIWEEMQGPIHAVDVLTTRTPAEVNQA